MKKNLFYGQMLQVWVTLCKTAIQKHRCALGFAEVAQLGERQTEDLKVPGSIPGFGKHAEDPI